MTSLANRKLAWGFGGAFGQGDACCTTPHALKLDTWAVPSCCVYVCVSVCVANVGGVGGTRQNEEDREAEEMTESVSGSPTAGLWILYFHSGPPALLTDALMKDKTELDGEHKQTHTHSYTYYTEKREKDSVAQKRSLYSM